MINSSTKRKIIVLFFFIFIFLEGYSQEFANETRREFNNFFWSQWFNSGSPDKILYDLLTNETIGTTDQEFISYYYIPEGSNKVYKASEIYIKSNNKISDIFLSYKFKTLSNATKWLNGGKFSNSSVSNKLVNNSLTNSQSKWRTDDNQLIFGGVLPNTNKIINYFKQNKTKIYKSNSSHVLIDQNYKGKSPDKQNSSMQNLVNLYIEAEEMFKGYILPNQTNPKDLIFEQIYKYIYFGEYPGSKTNLEFNLPNRYIFLKDLGIFVTMNFDLSNGPSISGIQIFDPINGPLMFSRELNGDQLFDNVSLTISESLGINEFKPPTTYFEKETLYFIQNQIGQYDKYGFDYRKNGKIWQGSPLPKFYYANISNVKINDLNYFIASNDLFKDTITNWNFFPSLNAKITMLNAGLINAKQAADPNFKIINQKEKIIKSGEIVYVLNQNGYRVTPDYDEIVQIHESIFRTKKENKYGLIFINQETIKLNNFILLDNSYQLLDIKKSDLGINITAKNQNNTDILMFINYNGVFGKSQ